MPPRILDNGSFELRRGSPGFRRALLINPPVYDAQYWARWSQPAGLLRIATHLKERGYSLNLIDSMEADRLGYVTKRARHAANGKQQHVVRGDMSRRIWHFGKGWAEIEQRIRSLDQPPHEVWITSIMTYWWESTRDMVDLVRRIYPYTKIFVGGIYPTLAPHHAQANLDADVIFKGELTAASDCWTDMSLYEEPPSYAILTTSRGCPWDCNYCAARSLNGGSNKMRSRTADDVVAEIADKKSRFGIHRFGFYEDNALALRGHLQRTLELLIETGTKATLYAPEGFETRMLNVELLRVMKRAGFKKVHLPFETLTWDTNLSWNRRHASTASFDAALEAAIDAGFQPRTQDINAFVLFGLPDENLEEIFDGVLYVHHRVGSIIPMLFTPVPGTHLYRKHADYLHCEMGWDLQHLNGKFLPFWEYNRRRYPELKASEYQQMEALMSVLNDGKLLSRAMNVCDDTKAAKGFRSLLAEGVPA